MPEIIFHPGIGKTGTSAIQRFAYEQFMGGDNESTICYAPIGLDGDNVHNSFADNHPSFSHQVFIENLTKLIEFAKSTNKKVLVSSEFLIRASAPHIKFILETLLNNHVEVKVVVAIRNYTDYLISSYLQAIKVKWGMKADESLQDYSAREIQNIRMPLLVDQWSRVIGDQHIYIFDYDKYKDSLLASFFDALGVTQVNVEDENSKVNSSIKLIYANILLEFDKVSGDMHKRKELINFLSGCSFNSFNESAYIEKVNEIVKNQYTHDYERLLARYTLL